MALRTTSSTRSRSSGFSMKSNAPSRVASTAVAIVPCPEMTTTGSVGSVLAPGEDLEAVHARHLDVEQDGVGAVASSRFKASAPDDASASS